MTKAQSTKKQIVKKRYSPLELLSKIYIILMLCVFPLYLHTDKYVHLTKHKATFFFVTTIAYLVILGIVWLLNQPGSKKKNQHFMIKLTFADWAVLAYLFVSILASIFSPFPKNVFLGVEERYDGLLTILLYGAAYFAISRTYKPRTTDLLFFAASSMLVSAIGILQYYGADIFSLFPYDQFPGITGRDIIFRTTLGNIDIVSAYTALTVLFFGMLYIKTENKLRYIYLAAGALNTFLMVLAGAEAGIVGTMGAFVLSIPFLLTDHKSIYRTAFLGFVYVLMIFFFKTSSALPTVSTNLFASKWLLLALGLLATSVIFYFVGSRIKINWSKKTVRILGVSLMILVILTGFVAVEVVGNDPSRGTLYEAREIMHGTLQDEFGTFRGFIWNRSFELLKNETPVGQLLIGSGPDTFIDRFAPYFSESIMTLDITYDKAHNEYLQILFCQGILGLASYVAFLIILLFKAIPKVVDNPLLLAASFASVSYMAQAFFSINVPIATPLFWVMLGIISLLSNKQDSIASLGEYFTLSNKNPSNKS